MFAINMSANKTPPHIVRQAKLDLNIEIGQGKRVPDDRRNEYNKRVAELLKVR